MIPYLDCLGSKGVSYYFHFTLNDYAKEKLEPNIQSIESRIKIFIQLSEKIGKEKVIWRFDPLILTDKVDICDLLKSVQMIGDRLYKYTKKLVFSFADIKCYKNVKKT